ncbi:MAG TPA: acyl-CoA reductase [Flavobacteriales bacterium]|nr:acyl-CoA reductase [Flavobacteriales bacterium]
MRIAALAQLGEVMRALGTSAPWPGHAIGLGEAEYSKVDRLIRSAHIQNGWATEENVRHAFNAWGETLRSGTIHAWLAAYPELKEARTSTKTIGLILAANVPLVGLHDVLCTWLSGHHARVKCSSQETELIPALVEALDAFAPGTAQQIAFTTGKLGDVDAVIATGSGNTSRYFEHYFGHLPRIVRKNRVSVALLDGTETEAELTALAEDVFRYFGLGCRNVSKVFVPQDFDLDRLFKAFFPWKDIVNHNKYANNYDYTRALWMLDGVKFLENGFFLVKEDAALASPVSTLFHERYTDVSAVQTSLKENADKIQCIVGHGFIPYGAAQQPALSDYADNVDTLKFLLDLE